MVQLYKINFYQFGHFKLIAKALSQDRTVKVVLRSMNVVRNHNFDIYTRNLAGKFSLRLVCFCKKTIIDNFTNNFPVDMLNFPASSTYS